MCIDPDEINSLVIVLFVRNGKLMGKNVNFMEKTYNMSDEEIMRLPGPVLRQRNST